MLPNPTAYANGRRLSSQTVNQFVDNVEDLNNRVSLQKSFISSEFYRCNFRRIAHQSGFAQQFYHELQWRGQMCHIRRRQNNCMLPTKTFASETILHMCSGLTPRPKHRFPSAPSYQGRNASVSESQDCPKCYVFGIADQNV